MDNDVYKPPEAEISVGKLSGELAEFYVVSVKKLLILYIGTLGLYTIYWFYQNWHLQKIKYHTNTWPVMRGLFAIFFVHSLFGLVDDRIKSRGIDYDWNPSVMATLLVLLVVAQNILGRIIDSEQYIAMVMFVNLWLMVGTVYILVEAQKVINLFEGDIKGQGNAHLTGYNALWLFFGVIFWLLIMLGLLITLNPTLIPPVNA
ncbi:MAG: hypothetical protein ACWA5R_06925 [bacterium]